VECAGDFFILFPSRAASWIANFDGSSIAYESYLVFESSFLRCEYQVRSLENMVALLGRLMSVTCGERRGEAEP
jgi:hypothetical protein